MSGDWLVWPTQVISRSESICALGFGTSEVNKFERKSFRTQVALGLELKKKKKKKKKKPRSLSSDARVLRTCGAAHGPDQSHSRETGAKEEVGASPSVIPRLARSETVRLRRTSSRGSRSCRRSAAWAC